MPVDAPEPFEAQIMAEFAQRRELFAHMAKDLQDILLTLIAREGVSISNLSVRIKGEETLRRKVRFKHKYTRLAEITDVIGCRIITLFEDDVDRVRDLVAREFDVLEVVERRRKHQETVDFGYNSLHMIVRFSGARVQLAEYQAYGDIPFEIQIRTVLQHAWAEIEHGLGYKNDFEIPRIVRRRLSRLSAALELLDEEFCNVRDEVERYSHSIDRIERVLKTDINLTSLRRYLDTSETVREINAEIAEGQGLPMTFDPEFLVRQKVPQKLAFQGIRYIHELDELLRAQRERIVSFGRLWLQARRPDGFNYYAIVHFALAGLALSEGEVPDEGQLKMLMESVYRLAERKPAPE